MGSAVAVFRQSSRARSSSLETGKGFRQHVEYTLIRPDVSTPIVHVDSPAPSDDILVDHLRNELAAAAEENEQLKAVISDLKAKAVVAENEIAGLMACRARLEDRVRELEAEHPAEPADVPVDTWDERKLIFVNNIVEQFADGKPRRDYREAATGGRTDGARRFCGERLSDGFAASCVDQH